MHTHTHTHTHTLTNTHTHTHIHTCIYIYIGPSDYYPKPYEWENLGGRGNGAFLQDPLFERSERYKFSKKK